MKDYRVVDNMFVGFASDEIILNHLNPVTVVDFIYNGLEAVVSEVAGDASSTSATLLSFGTGLVSLVFSFASAAAEFIGHIVSLAIGSLAVALSIESVALGFWSLIKSSKLSANQVLSAIGISLSVIAIYLFFTLQ